MNNSADLAAAYEAGAASQGETLRDKFAGQALISPAASKVSDVKTRAYLCYRMADAMLEARKKTGEPQ
jgi:hypothetical protein|tara:strand:- start:125 stop:328 length:204 start_codon:yes stop_codon:yes gene_type:complete